MSSRPPRRSARASTGTVSDDVVCLRWSWAQGFPQAVEEASGGGALVVAAVDG